jgi:transcriptional regulator with XRE-family HTH domain
MNVGERIRIRRKQLQLSQEDLARDIGSLQKQISRYETGENVPSVDVLIVLANVLQTSIDYLVGLTDDPSRRDVSADELTDAEKRVIALYRSGFKDEIDLVIELEKKRREKGHGDAKRVTTQPRPKPTAG